MATESGSDRDKPTDPADQSVRATSESTSKPDSKGPRLATARAFISTNPLAVALVSGVITAIASALLAVYIISPGQGAANKTAVQNQQEQQENTRLQYAEQVNYGLGTVPGSRKPQLMIFNRSNGWVRDITIIIPIPYQNSDGNISLPGFKTVNGMVGFESEGIDPSGADYTFQLLNLPPCEVGITAILSAVPNVSPAQLAASRLYFTDQKGVGWVLDGSGKLAEGSVPYYAQGQLDAPNGPGSGGWAWSSGADMRQLTSCPS